LIWNPKRVPDLPRWDYGGEAAFVPTRLIWNPKRVPDLPRWDYGGEAAFVPTRLIWNPKRVPAPRRAGGEGGRSPPQRTKT
jgi:hypothetical protein